MLALVALEVSIPWNAAAQTLFLVAENPALVSPCVHCDSFVVPIAEPGDILKARELIDLAGTGMGTIVVARIEAGGDGVNRDYLEPGFPSWSWRVVEFVQFADGTIEILDGWPSFIEDDPAAWIQNTQGYLGFWTYTVVQEIPEVGALGSGLAALTGIRALAFGRRRRRAHGQVVD